MNLKENKLFLESVKTYKDFLTNNSLSDLNNNISDFEYFTYNHPESGNFYPKEDYSIVLLYSGGIDSYIAYYYAKSKYKNIKLIFVNYGQTYAKQEYDFIKNQDLDVEYVDITSYTNIETPPTNNYGEIFPGRNWILATIASDYINKRGEIWMVAIGGEVKEKWGDKSEYFFREGSKILSERTNKNITITSPFKNKTKGQIVKWYLENGLDKNKLIDTVSCHDIDENNLPCGKCMGCAHRTVGFIYNNIFENNFRNDILKTLINLYSREINNEFSEFSEQRKKEISVTIERLQYLKEKW